MKENLDSNFQLDRKAFNQALYTALLKSLKNAGLNESDVIVIKTNLFTAIVELEKDINFLKMRRGCNPSDTKLAGVIIFRLMKHQIFNWTIEEPEQKDVYFFVCIAFNLIKQSLFPEIDVKEPRIAGRLKELFYQISQRHINQENIAVILDGVKMIDELLKSHKK
ncbi:MAG: hypothetical protein ACI86H_001084 [bacterium]|jgi:hypothetical protein